MGRRRRQDTLTLAVELIGTVTTLFFKMLIGVFSLAGQALSALFRLLAGSEPQPKRKHAIVREGSGRAIYNGLKKEYAGPTGKTAKGYFLEACERTGMTTYFSMRLLNHIRSEELKGLRAEGLADDILRRFPKYDKKELVKKVLTVMSISTSTFNRARAEEIGCEWYTWSSCKDALGRSSHRNMDGVLVSWIDPPSPEELIGEPFQGR